MKTYRTTIEIPVDVVYDVSAPSEGSADAYGAPQEPSTPAHVEVVEMRLATTLHEAYLEERARFKREIEGEVFGK